MDITESGDYRRREKQKLYMRQWRANRKARLATGDPSARVELSDRDRQKSREYGKVYYADNRERLRMRAQAHRHGLPTSWIKEALERQGNACAICKVGFSDEVRYCIDHDHATDVPRSLLCRYCNLGVGWAERPQMPEWLAYLERHSQ